ncbi:MAG: hypothetical protein IJS15_17040 [Victivallales bacterium]|nr:hypothetical protein [Victivallales bacterium]
MQNRKLTQHNEYNGHPTMTDNAHACDKAVLSALESTLNRSVNKANFPRLLLLEIQMHGECGEINDVFRAAQAEFVKCEKRRYGKPRYVGYKPPDAPNRIRLALIYDSLPVRDEAIEERIADAMKRKAPNGSVVDVKAIGESVLVGKPNYEDAFWLASSISCVPLRDEPRSRVLFTSKD